MCAAESIPSATAAPLVWALIGPKHGDNAQVRTLALALARVLGARVEERHLSYRGAELLVHLWPRPTLAGVLPRARSELTAPWPDLVIGAGRRSEPVARWIRRQSGARTRLVHLGRPWTTPAAFDLVVTNSQYRVPDAVNVLELPLPLTEPSAARVAPVGAGAAIAPDAGARWPFAELPRPWTGVLLGGDSGFLLFDAGRALELARRLGDSRSATGGSLLVTGSPRTPAAYLDALQGALEAPCFLHRWTPDAPNPYRTILASADVLIVTSDSVSMVVEALATGKPTYIHDLRPRGKGWWRHPREFRWRALSHRLVQAFAPARFRRDIRRIHERLVATGAARWLEGPARPFVPVPIDPDRDLAAVVERVREILERNG
jgi:mitochondrial fission protein ELM1